LQIPGPWSAAKGRCARKSLAPSTAPVHRPDEISAQGPRLKSVRDRAALAPDRRTRSSHSTPHQHRV